MSALSLLSKQNTRSNTMRQNVSESLEVARLELLRSAQIRGDLEVVA